MSNNLLDDDFRESPKQVELATFFDRVKASIIDTIVFLPLILLTVYNWTTLKIYALDLLINTAIILYKPVLEWHYGATVGKMITRIKVVDISLEPITLEQSFRRFSIYFIGYGISLISSYYLFQDPAFSEALTLADIGAIQQDNHLNDFSQLSSMAVLVSVTFVAFDIKRQALHDKLASTLCIKVD